jgi:anti-sigma factor RsiW
MNLCEDCFSRIDFYLDDELRGEDLGIFNDHVDWCAFCRRQLAERRLLLESVRASRPLYVASSEFLGRMAQLLEQEQAAVSPRNVQESRPFSPSKRRAWLRQLGALAASVLFVAVAAVLWNLSERQARANAFLETAIVTHQREISGRFPMEVRTNSEPEITQWFAHKVPFNFRLPSYSGAQKQNNIYALRGARLVGFEGDYAAYVCYNIGTQPISLLVTSASSAIASGGESTLSRGIAFHSHRQDGLQVVTWSVHGLTYALVSGVNLPGRQSCVVCHAAPKASCARTATGAAANATIAK